eukprot:6213610-Pleurochrysis_carterae.AAC.2
MHVHLTKPCTAPQDMNSLSSDSRLHLKVATGMTCRMRAFGILVQSLQLLGVCRAQPGKTRLRGKSPARFRMARAAGVHERRPLAPTQLTSFAAVKTSVETPSNV